MSNSNQNGRLVCLYAPISASRENRPLARSMLGSAKAMLLRLRDRAEWKLLRSHSFHYEAWRRTEYTNRGDIAIRQAIRQLLENSLGDRQFVELDWGDLDEAALDWINARADIFIICGGGFVSGDALTGKLSARMDDVTALAHVAPPVIAFGIGYNLLLECPRSEMIQTVPSETTAKLSALVQALDLAAVRDHDLEKMLRDVSTKDVAVVGDPALFLDAKKADLPKGVPGAVRMGLNFALHGPLSAAIFRSHFEDYVRFLKRIDEAYRVEFHYFVHCETERIAIALLRERGIIFHVVDCAPSEMVGAYSRMDFVICQMLHASVLSANAGIASINVGYDQKNLSFYQLFGMPELCLPHEKLTVERLWDLFASTFERRQAIALRFAARKNELRCQTNLFIAKLKDSLSMQDRATDAADDGDSL